MQGFLGLAQFESQLALLTLQRGDGNSTCSHHVDHRDEYVYLYIYIYIDIIYVLHIHILRIYSILSICIHRYRMGIKPHTYMYHIMMTMHFESSSVVAPRHTMWQHDVRNAAKHISTCIGRVAALVRRARRPDHDYCECILYLTHKD